MEEKLFKNYNKIRLEIKTSEQTLKMLHFKMQKLIGGPGDVKAQSYEEKSFSGSSKPIEQAYTEIVQLQQEINEEEVYLATCKAIIQTIETQISDFLKVNASQAELIIFQEHWIKGTPLSEIAVKKDKGKGYLDYRQIIRINRLIKAKIIEKN